MFPSTKSSPEMLTSYEDTNSSKELVVRIKNRTQDTSGWVFISQPLSGLDVP